LQFTVLPDGSVSGVIPVMKSDMLLEREAIAALKTWRFDPLPPRFEQKIQQANITFIFKLE
ncbi:MAG TPA: energy transducer TonB, partial [Bacteroidota bacterium]|nr:energy transducer TonB [Bacteroidota bacterium]